MGQEKSLDFNQNDSSEALCSGDMPPPIPSEYLNNPTAGSDKMAQNKNRPGSALASDISVAPSADSKLFQVRDEKQVPCRFRPADTITSVGSLRVSERQAKSIDRLIPRIVFWEQDTQRLPQLFFKNPHHSINDDVFTFYVRGYFKVEVRLIFTLGNAKNNYPKEYHPHMIFSRGDQPYRIRVDDFFNKCGYETPMGLLETIDGMPLDGVKHIKDVLGKKVDSLLVRNKMLPSGEKIALLSLLADKTSDAIQSAIEHTASAEKQREFNAFQEQLGKLLINPMQSLTYLEFFRLFENIKVILSGAKAVAAQHRDTSFRQALSFLSINTSPRSLLASEDLFYQSEQLLDKIDSGASRESVSDSKSMGRRR